MPTTKRMNCSQEIKCRVLNCHFYHFLSKMHTICDRVDHLESSDVDDTPPYGGNSKEYFMNFVQIPGGMGINGKLFENPGVSALTQSDDVSKHIKCNKCNKVKNTGCSCQNELNIPFSRTIQMIWTNHGKGATGNHPIHLHGHSFHVMKIVLANTSMRMKMNHSTMGMTTKPPMNMTSGNSMGMNMTRNSTTGMKMADDSDIECDDLTEYCNNPGWKNKNWADGNVPGLKLKNAPKKDTLMIPAGAYAVIRFKSNNPGKWLMHCHTGFHLMLGMA